MRGWHVKLITMLLAAVLAMSLLLGGTFAWENEQQALNKVLDEQKGVRVTLQKLEKDADGEPTGAVVPGAVFQLFRQDGTQIGGQYVTDEDGSFQVVVDAGNYYFEEIEPPHGFTFDLDAEGEPVTTYPFTVSGDALTVTAYNRRSSGGGTDPEPVEVALPEITKVVRGENAPEKEFTFVLQGTSGNPMPEAAWNQQCSVSRVGEGQTALGSITFSKPGDYVYTVYELQQDSHGWKYDAAQYTLKVHITLDGGALSGSYTIEKDGEETGEIVFTNTYQRLDLNETITISGQKTWYHRGNHMEDWPDHVEVLVYGNDVLTAQKTVTKDSDWKYTFELPKYDSGGAEISYRIDEEPVDGYTKEINGYDLTNTYQAPPVEPEPPEGPDSPADTGEAFNLRSWLVVMTCSLLGFFLMILLLSRNPAYRGKRVRGKGKRVM